MYKVVIADDRPHARQGLRLLLSCSSDYSIIGEACDGTEAIERTSDLRPDLLLTDLKMPGRSIIDGAAMLKAAQPHLKMIVLTAFDDSEDIYRAIHSGIDGYLMKDTDPGYILQVIHDVMNGSTYYQSKDNKLAASSENRGVS
ncbi:response regulator [Paenibacillus sp. strain BS8-2]